MKYPSKIFDYNESSISKFPIVLEALENEDLSILNLYKKVKKYFKDISTFIETLECLYILNAITYDKNKECLKYAL